MPAAFLHSECREKEEQHKKIFCVLQMMLWFRMMLFIHKWMNVSLFMFMQLLRFKAEKRRKENFIFSMSLTTFKNLD
jgi:hypothetical protein